MTRCRSPGQSTEVPAHCGRPSRSIRASASPRSGAPYNERASPCRVAPWSVGRALSRQKESCYEDRAEKKLGYRVRRALPFPRRPTSSGRSLRLGLLSCWPDPGKRNGCVPATYVPARTFRPRLMTVYMDAYRRQGLVFLGQLKPDMRR